MALAAATEEASSEYSDHFALGGPGTSSWHPKPSAGCQPLLCRGDWEGGSVGAGRAIASPSWQRLGSETTTPPSPRPPPAPVHHGPGTSSHLASPPAGIGRQDAAWLLGQPWVAKLPQCPCPPKSQPRASKGMGGQRHMVRVGGGAKLPPPLAARLPQPRAAGLAQPPKSTQPSPPLGLA